MNSTLICPQSKFWNRQNDLISRQTDLISRQNELISHQNALATIRFGELSIRFDGLLIRFVDLLSRFDDLLSRFGELKIYFVMPLQRYRIKPYSNIIKCWKNTLLPQSEIYLRLSDMAQAIKIYICLIDCHYPCVHWVFSAARICVISI